MSNDEAVIRGQGPCAFCGGPYAYHRVCESQMAMVIDGDEPEMVAADFGQTEEQMVAKWAAFINVLLDDLTGGER